MKKELPERLYPLSQSQMVMYMLVQFSIHKQVTQIPSAITVDEELDFNLLKTALAYEMERNDALRLRFIKVDKQPRQYFLKNAPMPDVPVVEFKTEEEQTAYLSKDAGIPIHIFKGEIFRIIFYKSFDGRFGIYFNVSHVVSDAFGAAVFFDDLLSVYRHLQNGAELPPAPGSYEEYIQKQLKYLGDEKRRGKDREFYKKYWLDAGEPFYAGVHGHAFLDKARKKKKNPDLRVPEAYDPIHDKADVIKMRFSKEDTDAIYEFCKKQLVTPEVVYMFALRAHCAKINYRTDDVLNVVMCNRRATKKEERIGGCLAQPLQCRIKTSEDESFASAVQKLAQNRYDLVRRMNFPYLEALNMQREIFGFKTSQAPSAFMFSWMPFTLAESKNGFNTQFTAYCMGRYIMPLYVFAVPVAQTGETDFYYMYRISSIKPEHLNALHEGMTKAIRLGTQNPDMTIGELFDKLDDFQEK